MDLEDLRSGLKESLEEMGYQVWASEFPDFPVDSNLHSHDNCLRNVERADQYVLITSDRCGAHCATTRLAGRERAVQPPGNEQSSTPRVPMRQVPLVVGHWRGTS